MNPPLPPHRLSEQTLFAGLAQPELEELAAAAVPKRAAAGAFFFLQGDPASHILLLTEGRARIYQLTADGQQVVHRLIGPWSLFGALALTQAETYPVNAEALEDSQAAAWSKEVLMGFVLRWPRMALNAMQMMAVHLQSYQDRFRELATERVEQRLARTLVRLAAQSGRKTEQGVLIDLPLSRQDLAEMTGTTLYTASRVLSRWEGQGLVILGRERVTIRYPHGLVSIAEDLPR